MKHVLLSTIVAISFSISSAPAAVVWNEAVNGNLSNNRLAPTPLSFAPGLNTFSGSLTGTTADVKWHDYITFQVPAGFALVSFLVDGVTSANSGATVVGIAAGAVFPSDHNGMNGNLMLGWTGVNPGFAGIDILPNLGAPNNSGVGNSGFQGPLKAGQYSVWIQDYDTPATYQFSIRLEAAVRPTIKVGSKKLSTKKLKLKGTASGTGTKVSYRLGTKGGFKSANIRDGNWSFAVTNLKKGPNVITIKAKGLFGVTTKKETIVVK